MRFPVLAYIFTLRTGRLLANELAMTFGDDPSRHLRSLRGHTRQLAPHHAARWGWRKVAGLRLRRLGGGGGGGGGGGMEGEIECTVEFREGGKRMIL